MRAVTPVYRYSMRPPAGGWNEQWARQQLVPAYQSRDDEVHRNGMRAVFYGTATADEASASHFHEVWQRVARDLGLDYRQEEIQ